MKPVIAPACTTDQSLSASRPSSGMMTAVYPKPYPTPNPKPVIAPACMNDQALSASRPASGMVTAVRRGPQSLHRPQAPPTTPPGETPCRWVRQSCHPEQRRTLLPAKRPSWAVAAPGSGQALLECTAVNYHKRQAPSPITEVAARCQSGPGSAPCRSRAW